MILMIRGDSASARVARICGSCCRKKRAPAGRERRAPRESREVDKSYRAGLVGIGGSPRGEPRQGGPHRGNASGRYARVER